MGAAEAFEARQQPLARKGGGGADGERCRARAPAHLLDRRRQAIEAVAEALEAGLTRFGEQDLAIEAAEQRHPQPFLERFHLMADRRRRHMQLGRRLAHAQVAGGGLEGAQRIEGRQPAAHSRHFRVRYSKSSTEK
jgi:hypothetical protein